MNKFKILLTFLTAVFISSFVAQDGFKEIKNPSAVLAKLQEVSKATKTISTDFTETKHIAVLTTPQIATGKMYYKQQDKMKWMQQKPFEYIILINGEQLRIKDNGKEKSFSEGGKIASRINKFMMGLIQGDYQDSRGYTSKFFESGDRYLVELTPTVKSLSKVYDKLELYFDKKEYRLHRIKFFEASGDLRDVEFHDQIYNGKIEESVFQNL